MLALLGGCAMPALPEECGDLSLLDQFDPDAPYPGFRCEDFPLLCGQPVDSIVNEPDRAAAYDIVFVSEGYTAGELKRYRERVESLIEGLTKDANGIVAPRIDSFNFHTVDIASPAGARLTNSDRTDSALGGCFSKDDPKLSDDFFLRADRRLASLAAIAHVESADAIVVVMDTGTPARANASLGQDSTIAPAIIHLGREHGSRILTHELGHALFGLGDEYADSERCYDPYLPVFSTLSDPLIGIANLTLDASGAKWAGLVDGAREGGFRHGACVYHPTNGCRMRSSEADAFCPVCAAAIERASLAHRGTWDDGPPTCGIELDQHPTQVSGSLKVALIGHDLGRVDEYGIYLDDEWILQSLPGPEQERIVTGATSINTVALTNGPHQILARCIDRHGNTGTGTVQIHVQNPD